MSAKIGELLARRAGTALVGRREELAALLRCLDFPGPLVTWVHGIAGIGKSSLVHAFAAAAQERGAAVYVLDCRLVEPTEAGALAALGELLGEPLPDAQVAGTRLSAGTGAVALVLDHYEVFRLADTWLRQRLLPALGAQARVVIASREAPPAAWAAGDLGDLFASCSLEGLAADDAIALLRQAGVDAAEASRIATWTQGHPLALRMAASSAGAHGRAGTAGGALPVILAELARIYLEEVPDRQVRQALEAIAAVRRATRPLLAALCPEVAAGALYDRLAALHFVEQRGDGLALHEAIRDAIAATVKAADPAQLRRSKQIAWQLLRDSLRATPAGELWRWTADAIYLIEHPVIREAFFPSRSASYDVEPARPADGREILAISDRFDTGPARGWIGTWWDAAPDAFHVIRDARGALAGFYCMASCARVDPAWLRHDAVAWRWWQHLQDAPRAHRRNALFLRRWLASGQGESPGPVQAAGWLDIKRSYLELRPDLRRVYFCLRELAPYAAVAQELGFRVIDEASVVCGSDRYHTGMLDFGPGSVDGWICDLVARELGMDSSGPLDALARQLVIDGRRIDLTPLEYDTLRLLQLRSGEAVSRPVLLDEVWGRGHEGGSNVVDTVVHSLRRKLGAQAWRIETVHGVGYRYRPVLMNSS